MTVTVEVPNGHKFCKSCGGVFPLDTGFYFKKSTNPKTGTVSTYAESKCKTCSNATRKAVGWHKPDKPKATGPRPFTDYWPRHPEERGCDAALMGWRVAHHATVVAFQGPRI
jgi:hypothetical protein